MKTKKLALAVVGMILFSAFNFTSCSSDELAPDASSKVSNQDSTITVNDSLIADSLHHGRKPHCDSSFVKHPRTLDSTFVKRPKPLHDSTFVRPPKPTHDSTFVKRPKPSLDSTFVKHPKPVFDSLPKDSLKSHRPHTFQQPKGGKHGRR